MARAAYFAASLAVCIAALAWHFGGPRGPSLAQVEHLRAPRIYEKQAKTLLVSRQTAAAAEQVAKAAFGIVFSAYFKLYGAPASAPTGRWWNNTDGTITGEVGIEIPAGASGANADLLPPGTAIVVWEYGSSVAEILHVGSYATETATIEKLRDFTKAKGMRFTNNHEEEYLRGPGFLFKGDPSTYLTLIRYPVVADEEAQL